MDSSWYSMSDVSMYAFLKSIFDAARNHTAVNLYRVFFYPVPRFPPPRLDERPKLSLDASAEQVVERLCRHLALQMLREPSYNVLVSFWFELQSRLDFLLGCSLPDDQVKHILISLLYVCKIDESCEYIWNKLILECARWVNRKFAIVQGVEVHWFEVPSFFQSSSLEQLSICGIAQNWIYTALSQQAVLWRFCDLLAPCCSLEIGYLQRVIKNVKVHQVSRSVPGELNGFVTFDGICLIVDNYPVISSVAELDIVLGHVFQLVVHELSHYLFRKMCNDIDASSPFCRGKVQFDQFVQFIDALPTKAITFNGVDFENFELGIAAELSIVGLSVNFRTAVEKLRLGLVHLEFLRSVVDRMRLLAVASRQHLPLFTTADKMVIRAAGILFEGKLLCFGLHYSVEDEKFFA